MEQLDFLANTATNLFRAPDRRSLSKCDMYTLTERKLSFTTQAVNFKEKE